jgi:hypothetical protein
MVTRAQIIAARPAGPWSATLMLANLDELFPGAPNELELGALLDAYIAHPNYSWGFPRAVMCETLLGQHGIWWTPVSRLRQLRAALP